MNFDDASSAAPAVAPTIIVAGAKFKCTTCNSTFASPELLEQHSTSRTHLMMVRSRQTSTTAGAFVVAGTPNTPQPAATQQQQLQPQAPNLYCVHCEFVAETENGLAMHGFSLAHQTSMGPAWQPEGDFVCLDCRFNFESAPLLQEHEASSSHATRVGELALQQQQQQQKQAAAVKPKPAATTKTQKKTKAPAAPATGQFTCVPCGGVHFNDPNSLLMHNYALSHQRVLGAAWQPMGAFSCFDCSLSFVSAVSLGDHVRGSAHAAMLLARGNEQQQQPLLGQSIDPSLFGTSNPQLKQQQHQHQQPQQQHHQQQSLVKVKAKAPAAQPACVPCGYFTKDALKLKLHCVSLAHQRTLGEAWQPQGKYTCFDCRFNFIDLFTLRDHVASARHAATLARLADEQQPVQGLSVKTKKLVKKPQQQQPQQQQLQQHQPQQHHHQPQQPQQLQPEYAVLLQQQHGPGGAFNVDELLQQLPELERPCNLCELVFPSTTLLRQHVQSKEHRRLFNAVVAQANAGFGDLEKMNEWLVGLGEDAEPSKTKARNALRQVHINIFDLVLNKYHLRQDSLSALRSYTEESGLYFPLAKAKQDGAKVFLRPLRPPTWAQRNNRF